MPDYRNIRAIGLEALIRQFAQEEIDASGGGGGGSGADTDDLYQETLVAESIVGVDKTLADTLSIPPKDADGVTLFLNGVAQDQGPGKDYELVGVDLTQIRWLAGTGTAVYLEVDDELLVVYEIEI